MHELAMRDLRWEARALDLAKHPLLDLLHGPSRAFLLSARYHSRFRRIVAAWSRRNWEICSAVTNMVSVRWARSWQGLFPMNWATVSSCSEASLLAWSSGTPQIFFRSLTKWPSASIWLSGEIRAAWM
jgi:hypothetical protein